MGIILAWYPNPAPDDIDIQTWNGFVNNFAPVLIILIGIFLILAVYFYKQMASHLRIHTVDDVFRPYGPMKALWWGVVGSLVSGIVAAIMYWNMVANTKGMVGFSLTMLLLTLLLCEVFSYVIVAYAPGLTPPQFRYRPSRLLQKKGKAH